MKIVFVTGARSEWRLVEPLLRAAKTDAGLTPLLFVTGSHLSRRHGYTIEQIRAAGWEPAAGIEILENEDTPPAIARATGRVVSGFADALAAHAPDWVVVTGDRYESFGAAAAATMLGIPLAHVAGGETDLATNQDCNLRNAMTKLAQAHFVAHDLARRRVLALGEEPWRVRVAGLPSLDEIETQCAARGVSALVEARCLPAKTPFLLVSYLPVTLSPAESRAHLAILLDALAQIGGVHKLFVLSNADAGGDEHDRQIRAWAKGRDDATMVPSLEPALYLAALRDCACYVGNSSSGVIESPAFGTPAVIVGPRQAGRPMADNVREIRNPNAILLTNAIREQLAHGPYRNVVSPFGDGRAARHICDGLLELRRHPQLMAKRLVVPEPTAPQSSKKSPRVPEFQP